MSTKIHPGSADSANQGTSRFKTDTDKTDETKPSIVEEHFKKTGSRKDEIKTFNLACFHCACAVQEEITDPDPLRGPNDVALVPIACEIFHKSNSFRLLCVSVLKSPAFDNFILAAIVLNSIVLALVDYEVTDELGEPIPEGSARNTIVEASGPFFTWIFFVECCIKIVSLGFVMGKNTYLRDPWNILDFVVVIVAFLEILPGMPNLSALRTCRVLRPLRSLSKFPGLKKLVGALLDSLPGLMDVIFLLLFVLSVFSIVGVNFFGGLLHSRCRLTPFPVTMNATCTSIYDDCWENYLEQVIADPDAYKCLDVENDNGDWTKSSSPWAEEQDCIWPLDTDDTQICNINSGGDHSCFEVDSIKRYCGSDFDVMGNSRFIESVIPYGVDRMKVSTYNSDLNWGITMFDNFLMSMLSVFQSVTMEGWSDIMYMCMAGVGIIPSVVTFMLLILFGSFFMLNLVLAIITDCITSDDEEEENEADHSAKNESVKKAVNALQKVIRDKRRPAWRKKLHRFVQNPIFSGFIIFAILCNTVVLAMDKYPMDPNTVESLSTINVILTLIFTFEMVVTIIALGPHEYCMYLMNLFDAFVVITSLIELGLEWSGVTGEGDGGGISALRTFRLFRVFKLAKDWKSFQTLLQTIMKTVLEIGNFAILLILFMYIYALVGMQFFANKLHFHPVTGAVILFGEEGYEDAEIPRANFDSLLWALVTIFQVLTGENWNAVMYDGIRATSFGATIYFLSLVVLGGFIVMNLFLAILLSNFEGNDDLIKSDTGMKGKFDLQNPNVSNMRAVSIIKVFKQAKAKNELEKKEDPDKEPNYFRKQKLILKRWIKKCIKKARKFANDRKEWALFIFPPEDNGNETDSEDQSDSVVEPSAMGRVRQICSYVSTRPQFDNIIICLIIFSSLMLAVDNPLNDPESDLMLFLVTMDLIMTILFTGEMCLKIISKGFMFMDNAYLKNGWNVLDFIIVIVGLMALMGIGPGKALKPMRTVRVLRPLRMISRRPELKLVVDALLSSIPAIINVVVVCVLFFLIFAILAVNYLKGSLYACQGDGFDALSAAQQDLLTYPEKWSSLDATQQAWFSGTTCANNMYLDEIPLSVDICDCLVGEDAWVPVINQNFDNVFVAMSCLYEISTTEGWTDVMFAAVDQRGIGMQPVRDASLLWVAFFVSFMIIGGLFLMNLFVGVVIDNFNDIRAKKGTVFMTKEQDEWAKTQKIIMKIKPKRLIEPKNWLQKWCGDVIRKPNFDIGIMSCIILNSIVMAMTHFGQSDAFGTAMDNINFFFAFVFTGECIIKLIALRTYYFSDGWNKFDFTIVIGTALGIIIQKFTSIQNLGTIASVVRLFRIGRVFRLINSAQSLRQLFNTLVASLPSLVNVGGLLFLLFFMYAVCGVQLFATVEYKGDYNYRVGFRTFGVALLTLFRYSTGENWNGVMYGVSDSSEGCVETPVFNANWCVDDRTAATGCVEINGCGQPTALPYFYSFTLVVTFVMLNLFIGVILDAFASSDEEGVALPPKALDEFIECWSKFDINANCFIPVERLPDFFQILDAPMGFGLDYNASDEELRDKIRTLDIPIRDKETRQVHFSDVARALAKKVVITKLGDNFMELPEDHAFYQTHKENVGENMDYTIDKFYLEQELKLNQRKGASGGLDYNSTAIERLTRIKTAVQRVNPSGKKKRTRTRGSQQISETMTTTNENDTDINDNDIDNNNDLQMSQEEANKITSNPMLNPARQD